MNHVHARRAELTVSFQVAVKLEGVGVSVGISAAVAVCVVHHGWIWNRSTA